MQLLEPEQKFLSERAFPLTVDPRLLWRSGQYADVLRRLATAITGNGGLLLLVGEAGTGKTILTNALLEDLAGQDVKVCKLPSPGLSSLDFRTAITDALGLMSGLPTSEAFRMEFARILDDSGARGERLLLVVDDAQNLSSELWAEIGSLLEVSGPAGSARSGLFSTLLVGDDDLEAILRERTDAALRSRIKVCCRLVALKADQVSGYCSHHLDMAGLGFDCFTRDALREVAVVSRGIPRLIDLVCSKALAVADLRRMPGTNALLIRECAEQTRALELARLGAERSPRRCNWAGERQSKLTILAVARTLHEGSRTGGSQAKRALLAAEATARMWSRAGGEQTKLAVLAVERTVRKWSRLAAEQVKLAVVAANQRGRMGAKQSRLTVRAGQHRLWERTGKIKPRHLPAVVGLASLALTFAYAHRLLEHVRHESTAMEFVVPGTDTRGIEPVAARPTIEAPSVALPIILPPSASTERPPHPPDAERGRTSSPPNGNSEGVDRSKKEGRPVTPVPRPGRTTKEKRPSAGSMSTPTAMPSPRQPTPSASRPSESIRGEEQDPGAIIDWLLKAAPRRGD